MFVELAKAYAMTLSTSHIQTIVKEMYSRVKEAEDFSLMQEAHIQLSGAKALYT